MLLQIFIWSTGVNAAFSLAMGAFVLMSRPVTNLKLRWSATCGSVAVWSGGLYLMATAKSLTQAQLSLAMVNYSLTVLPVFLLATIGELLKRPIPAQKILIISAVTMSILNWLSLIATVKPFPPFYYYTSALPLYSLFLAHLNGAFLFIAFLLWKEIRRAREQTQRSQLQLLLAGICVSFAGGQTTIPMVYGFHFFPFGILTVPVFVMTTGYGMFKYSFLDFKFAVRRLLLAAVIYVVTGLAMAPIASPLLISLIGASLTPASLVAVSFFSGLYLASGPLVYSILVARSYWLRGHLSMGLAHELRSPVNIIQAAVSIIRERLRENAGDKKLIEYLDMIESNADRLDRFSADLLLVAKESESVSLNLSKESIFEMLSFAIDDNRVAASLKDIEIELEKIGPDRMVLADRKKTIQAISNIILNAIKYSDTGKIRATIDTTGAVVTRVSIRDYGIGVSKEMLRRMFVRFAQADGSRGGAGLGLSIAKTWIEAHRGRIWAESEGVGRGTKVTFTLPGNS